MANVSEVSAWKGLASAIVIQAAEDYGNYLLGNYDKNLASQRLIYEGAKQFLLSDIMPLYTNIPGKTIVKKVEKMVENWPVGKKFSLGNEF